MEGYTAITEYLPVGLLGAAGLAVLYKVTRQATYKRTKWEPEDPEALPRYDRSQKIYDVSHGGCLNIRYATKGTASVRTGTMVERLRECVRHNGGKVALRVEENNHTATVGEWREYTWTQYYETSAAFAKSLLSLGFEKYSTVAICAFNAPPWSFAQMGVVMAGGKSAGIYTTNTPEACQYVVAHSDATVIVVDTVATLKKFLSVKAKMPLVKRIVVFLEDVPSDVAGAHKGYVCSWHDFLALGSGVADKDLDHRMQTVRENECCSLIYTSGTTGNPKAVMLSHDNGLWAAYSGFTSVGLEPHAEDHILSYLPLSHIAAQMYDIFYPLWYASQSSASNVVVSFARPDVLKGSLPISLRMVRPTLFVGVPRVWEKFVEGIKEKAKAAPPMSGIKKRFVDWCKGVGLRAALAQQVDGDGKVPRGYAIADKILFSKVREALGLDRCRFPITGAAPVPREVMVFLAQLGIVIREGYGMSESAAGATVGRLGCWRWGSCGCPILGQEVRIFHDPSRDKPNEGEICFRGRQIMIGYLKEDAKTREAIDADGWLHSGDVGKFDEYGQLFITGRIKELLIGTGGENIAPVPIEDEIKRLCPALSNAVMIGDKRKYNVMLVTVKSRPDLSDGTFTDELMNEALAVNPFVKTVTAALADKSWNDHVMKAIKAYNDGGVCVSNAQKIQKFRILPTDLSIPGGELTPTMKLKRNVLCEKYAKIIDSMYDE